VAFTKWLFQSGVSKVAFTKWRLQSGVLSHDERSQHIDVGGLDRGPCLRPTIHTLMSYSYSCVVTL